MKLNVLITGATGFIGKHVTKKFIDKGHNVSVFIPPNDNLDTLKPASVFRGYLQTHINDLELATEFQDVIIHLAAKARIPESETNWNQYFQSNVVGTQNLINAAIKNNVKHVVYAGSSTYYGNAYPQYPEVPGNPLNYYAWSKKAGEEICKITPGAPPCSILRIFTTYGPGQPTGKDALVIGRFFQAEMNGEPITIDGDGSQSRDFVHVYDVANAFYNAATMMVPGVFNIGTGVSTTIADLAKLFNAPVQYGPARPKYAAMTCAEVSNNTVINWKAQTQLHEGIQQLRQLYARSNNERTVCKKP